MVGSGGWRLLAHSRVTNSTCFAFESDKNYRHGGKYICNDVMHMGSEALAPKPSLEPGLEFAVERTLTPTGHLGHCPLVSSQ